MTLKYISCCVLSLSFGVSQVTSAAEIQDPSNIQKFLQTLRDIDPEKTDDPEKFKKMRTIAENFSECLSKSSGKTKEIERLACISILEAHLNKLNQAIGDISEAEFVKNIRQRALHNLGNTYAYLSYQFRNEDQDSFSTICEDLNRDLKMAAVCESKDGDTLSTAFNLELVKMRNEKPKSLTEMQNQYESLINSHLNGETYLAKCEQNRKQFIDVSKNPALDTTERKLRDLRPELALHVRSQSLSALEIKNQPIALLFSAEYDQREVVTNPDIFSSLKSDLGGLTSQAKKSVRQQAAELLGFGEEEGKTLGGKFNATKDEIKKIPFYAKNYPVALGQALAQFPNMIKSACMAVSELKDKGEGYNWGDRILGSKVMLNSVYDGVLISSNFSKEEEKRISAFLKKEKMGCEAIQKQYEAEKAFADDRAVELKEFEFKNAFRLARNAMPASDLSETDALNSLKINQACSGMYYNRFKIDMMNRQIAVLKKISEDKSLAKKLNEYARKKRQSEKFGDFTTNLKLSLLMGVIARLPEYKITDKTKTQDKLINHMKKQLEETGSFDIDALVDKEDTICYGF